MVVYIKKKREKEREKGTVKKIKKNKIERERKWKRERKNEKLPNAFQRELNTENEANRDERPTSPTKQLERKGLRTFFGNLFLLCLPLLYFSYFFSLLVCLSVKHIIHAHTHFFRVYVALCLSRLWFIHVGGRTRYQSSSRTCRLRQSASVQLHGCYTC